MVDPKSDVSIPDASPVLEPPEGLSSLIHEILSETTQTKYQVGRPRNDTEAASICDRLARSEAIPKSYIRKPGDIYAVMIAGQRFGLDVMQSMMAFCVVNGMPRLWGDAAHAIFKKANAHKIEVLYERPPQIALKEQEGLCRIKFKDSPECDAIDDGGCGGETSGAGCCTVRRFSHEDAVKAGLIDRSKGYGPWSTYEGRMLQMRSRSWAERDSDPGAFCGFGVAEEQQGISAANRELAAKAPMPRRKSEAPPEEKTPTEVSDVLKGGGAKAAPKLAATTRSADKAPPGERVIDGTVESVEKKTKGKLSWYEIKFGQAGSDKGFGASTFSETTADLASSYASQKTPIRAVLISTVKKGTTYWNVSSIEEVENPE